jgi:hypothetical protein
VEIPWLDRDCSVPARPGVGSTRLFTDARCAHLAQLDPLDVVALGLIASLTLLAAPAASLVAGFYLDNIANAVEREIDPLGLGDVRCRCPLRSIWGCDSLLSLLVNLAVLALTLFTPWSAASAMTDDQLDRGYSVSSASLKFVSAQNRSRHQDA